MRSNLSLDAAKNTPVKVVTEPSTCNVMRPLAPTKYDPQLQPYISHSRGP